MGEWMDIKTAPKDGTRILLGRFVRGDKHDGFVSVDWWRLPSSAAGFVGYGSFHPTFWPATHWMPLPEPPAQP